jgi:hypothetical protein
MDRPKIPRRALELKFKETGHMEQPRMKWFNPVLKNSKWE